MHRKARIIIMPVFLSFLAQEVVVMAAYRAATYDNRGIVEIDTWFSVLQWVTDSCLEVMATESTHTKTNTHVFHLTVMDSYLPA